MQAPQTGTNANVKLSLDGRLNLAALQVFVCVALVQKGQQQMHHHALCVHVVHTNKVSAIQHVNRVMLTQQQ